MGWDKISKPHAFLFAFRAGRRIARVGTQRTRGRGLGLVGRVFPGVLQEPFYERNHRDNHEEDELIHGKSPARCKRLLLDGAAFVP